MKVIVNHTTDLQVIDEEGNVLYDWNPFKDKTTYASGNSVIDCITNSYVSGEIIK